MFRFEKYDFNGWQYAMPENTMKLRLRYVNMPGMDGNMQCLKQLFVDIFRFNVHDWIGWHICNV